MLTHKDEEIAGWNAKAQEVVRHYGTYNGQSGDNTAGLPRDYGDLTLPSGGADIEHAEKAPAVIPPGGHDDHRTGTDRTTQVEHRGTDVGGQDTSGQQRPGNGTVPGHDTRTVPGQDTPGQQRPATGPGQDDATRTTGLTPISPVNAGESTSPPGPGFGRDGGSGDVTGRLGPGVPVVGGPGVTGRIGTPGTGGEPGSGRRGTGGEPGGGRGGTGSGSRPGGGRGGSGSEPGGRSGAGRFGEPGAARPGLAGAAGKPGAGAMGAPVGRGSEKEEDKEHKRLDILQEPDPDELFGGFPDGMKPVPPTIGL
ncbi:hypothetical protein SAMN04489727_0257 [Amycolatopsis tolypomycina]|uniref:Uncharacterized protein n=1 Tax=Amycolatopsis tolypomycina TaxID=208445 RepID=A0A1H4I7W0_9PSEU|nr:hypothetical protein [Amycolatopsis tolypomycina]SEB30063.1 hypothetical protein SAMN04489727_0257 [Amycolatopsis tolypomycina]